jgi:hypothetical protein
LQNDFDNHGGDRGNGHGFSNRNSNNSNFGFVQPGLNLEVNVFKYGKLYLGASYRIATNVDSDAVAPYTLTTAQVSGLNINIGAKIGLFNFNVAKSKE